MQQFYLLPIPDSPWPWRVGPILDAFVLVLLVGFSRLKSEVQGKIEEEGGPESISSSEGIHETIEDILKAMKGLASYLS